MKTPNERDSSIMCAMLWSCTTGLWIAQAIHHEMLLLVIATLSATLAIAYGIAAHRAQ
jgi:hypothetical protein